MSELERLRQYLVKARRSRTSTYYKRQLRRYNELARSNKRDDFRQIDVIRRDGSVNEKGFGVGVTDSGKVVKLPETRTVKEFQAARSQASEAEKYKAQVKEYNRQVAQQAYAQGQQLQSRPNRFNELVAPYQDQQSTPEYSTKNYSPVTQEFIYAKEASDTGFERRIKSVGRAERNLQRDINARLPEYLKAKEDDGLFKGTVKNLGSGAYMLGSDAVNLVRSTNPIAQIIDRSKGRETKLNVLTARSLGLTARKIGLYGEAGARAPFNRNIREPFKRSSAEQGKYLLTDTFNPTSPTGLSNYIVAGAGAGIATSLKFRPVNRIQNQPAPTTIKVAGTIRTKADTWGSPRNVGGQSVYKIKYSTGSGKSTIYNTITKTTRGGYIQTSTTGKTTLKTVVDPKRQTSTTYRFTKGRFQGSKTKPYTPQDSPLQSFEELLISQNKGTPQLVNQGTGLLQEAQKRSAFNVRGNFGGQRFEGTLRQQTQAKSFSQTIPGTAYREIKSPTYREITPLYPKLGVSSKSTPTPKFKTQNIGNKVILTRKSDVFTTYGYETKFVGVLNKPNSAQFSNSLLASKKAQIGRGRLITQYVSPLDIDNTRVNLVFPQVTANAIKQNTFSSTSPALFAVKPRVETDTTPQFKPVNVVDVRILPRNNVRNNNLFTNENTGELTRPTFESSRDVVSSPRTINQSSGGVQQVQSPQVKTPAPPSIQKPPALRIEQRKVGVSKTPFRNNVFSRFIPLFKTPKLDFTGVNRSAGYSVFAKVRGQFKQVSQSVFNFRDARTEALSFLDNTPSATAKIVKVFESPNRKSSKRAPFFDNFVFKANNVFVEKPKARINTQGELRGITRKGQATIRARSKIL